MNQVLGNLLVSQLDKVSFRLRLAVPRHPEFSTQPVSGSLELVNDSGLEVMVYINLLVNHEGRPLIKFDGRERPMLVYHGKPNSISSKPMFGNKRNQPYVITFPLDGLVNGLPDLAVVCGINVGGAIYQRPIEVAVTKTRR
jgi:hypothetical protein